MNRTGALGAAILLLSLVGVGAGTWCMAKRVQTFNTTLPDPFHFVAEDGREFFVRGKKVTLTDETIKDAQGGEQAAVKVTYGDTVAHIPVIAPRVPNFKDLSVYEDTFRVLSFVPTRAGQSLDKPFSDENWRAVIVARHTAEGWDEKTWGQVRVKDWTFRLYELLPDGAISGPREMQFRVKKYGTQTMILPAAKADPNTKIEPIEERTWEWQAALYTVPKAQVSRYRFNADAVGGGLTGGGMGWTLPVAGYSVMGCVLGVILLGISRTKRAPINA